MIMKKFVAILAVMMLAISCTAPIPESLISPEEEQSNVPVVELSIQLSEFVGTKASEPLEGTIWEHITGEQLNKYVLFEDGAFKLFYGMVWDDELERWSEY